MKQRWLTLYILMLMQTSMGCGLSPYSVKDCGEHVRMRDSLRLGNRLIFVGSEKEQAALYVRSDNQCIDVLQQSLPNWKKEKGTELDSIQVQGKRIAIRAFHRSEGDNTAYALLISPDLGNTWSTLYADSINPASEGIQTIQLVGEQGLHIKLFNLEGPTHYQSTDNGISWTPSIN